MFYFYNIQTLEDVFYSLELYLNNIYNEYENLYIFLFLNWIWDNQDRNINEVNLNFWNPYIIYNLVSWKLNFRNKNFQDHYYHLVNASYWPFLGSIFALNLLIGLTMWMHNYYLGGFFFLFAFSSLLILSYAWWKDIVREGTFLGFHSMIVKKGLRIGMILFIISEIMFFFSFFWAFFHSSLNPSIVLGSVWPPIGIKVINPMHIPLLNTLILLTSGITLTWSHHRIKFRFLFNRIITKNYSDFYFYYPLYIFEYKIRDIDWKYFEEFYDHYDEFTIMDFLVFEDADLLFIHSIYNYFNVNRSYIWDNEELIEFIEVDLDWRDWSYYLFLEANLALLLTIFLGIEFTLWQLYEYYHAIFYIFDGVYGSTFYMTTGLHGFHVLIGTIFLIICFIRLINSHFNWKSHVGYESAIWYWHFVDVVWIIVFSCLYCWGAGISNIIF